MTGTPTGLTDPPGGRLPAAPIELLNAVLSRVRLAGALFLLGEYSAPWGYQSPASSDLSQFLDLPPRRLFMFHLIAEGECVIRLIGGQPLPLRAGDVVVLPGGHPHFMESEP